MKKQDIEKFEHLRNQLVEDANYQRNLVDRLNETDMDYEIKKAEYLATADGIDRARRELEKTLYMF